MLGHLATRLAGSSDLYEPGGRRPYHSINFITSHDGFTLNDLVSYNEKHNEVNGEGNRDGDNNNFSCNYGVEGPTRHKGIEKLRLRQIKNFLTSLLLSQGVPMLLAGDECRRTQHGNNNAYCQDNEISWFDWNLVNENKDLVRFCRALIAFRRRQPTVRRKSFLTGQLIRPGLSDVNWYSAVGTAVDWSGNEQCLIYLLAAPGLDEDPEGLGRDVLILFNNSQEFRQFILPAVAKSTNWRLAFDTAGAPPLDAFPDGDGPALPKAGAIRLPDHTVRCYVASPESQPLGTRRS
jgi:glycogen operon protein